MKLSCLLAIALILTSFNGHAQITPPPSSSETISQGFGLGTISITYSRPNTKGRKIFGYVEPYDKVWRTGANSATVIKFTDDVTIEGNKVPRNIRRRKWENKNAITPNRFRAIS